jgi:hypothetical protein
MSFDTSNLPKELDYNSVTFYQGLNIMEENRRGDTKAYARCVQGLSDWLVPYHDTRFNNEIKEFDKWKVSEFKQIEKELKGAEGEAAYNSVEHEFSRKVFVACMQLIKRGSFLPQRREQEIIDEDAETVWGEKDRKKKEKEKK